MPPTSLQLFRTLVSRQTEGLDRLVSNLYGSAAPFSSGPAVTGVAFWRVIRVSGPETADALAILALTGNPDVPQHAEVVEAVNGVVLAPATDLTGPGSTLFVGRARVTGSSSVGLSFASPQAGTQSALYVDGVRLRTGTDLLEHRFVLAEGDHAIALATTAREGVLALPRTFAVTASDSPARPAWLDAYSEYVDPALGTRAAVLEWVADASAGGWVVFRRSYTSLGAIASVMAGDALGQSQVVVSGDVTGLAGRNASLAASGHVIGSVRDLVFDDPVTRIAVSLGDGVAPDDSWVGNLLAVLRMDQVARLDRSAGLASMTWRDPGVGRGGGYEYLLRAFGLFDPSAWSALSEPRYLAVGDTTPPDAITFVDGTPTWYGGTATARFLTPSDLDYAGVRVLSRTVYDSGMSPGGNTATRLYLEHAVEAGALENATLAITGGTGAGQLRTVDANGTSYVDIDAGTPFSPVPDGTSVYEVVWSLAIVTDYGLPATTDELSFRAYSGETYHFLAFDRGGNLQSIVSGESWVCSGGAALVATVPPTIGLKQLDQAFQSTLNPPYNSTQNYAVVELSANDAVDGPDAVVIHYQLRDGLERTMLATTPATGNNVDAPPGGTRNRKVAVSREQNDNWIRAWASDADALDSGMLTYRVDFDNTPEIASVDTRVDMALDAGRATVVVDDDTQSFTWWLAGESLGAGDPTAGSPALVADTTTVKAVMLQGPAVASGLAFALPPGTRKVLTVRPYALVSGALPAGEDYVTEFARAPITHLTVEGRDASGRLANAAVKLTFTVDPTIADQVAKGSGTATGTQTSTTLQDSTRSGGTAWATGQFASDDATLAFWYVRISGPEGHAATGQCRRIASNTGSVLTLTEGWTTLPSDGTSAYQVQKGAVVFRTGGGGPFLGAVQPVYRLRTEGGESVEYYAEVSGAPPEITNRMWIDPDTSPSIVLLTVTEENGALTVSMQADDDLKEWKCYARRGQWPTLPSGSVPPNGTVDEAYLKYRLPVSKASVTFDVEPGNWYVAALPLDSLATPGVVSGMMVTVTGSASTPALGDLATDDYDTGGVHNRISWGHNVSAGGAGKTVRVYGYRADLGQGTEELLVTGRRADWDADDTEGTSNYGAYLHDQALQRGGDVGYTWNYRVELWEGSTKWGTWTTTHSGSYALAVPDVSNCTVDVDDGSPACDAPLVASVAWTCTDANDDQYYLALDVAKEEETPFTFNEVTTGLSTYSQGYDDGHWGRQAGGMTLEYWTYRVRVVRKSDSVTIDSATSSTTPPFSKATQNCDIS